MSGSDTRVTTWLQLGIVVGAVLVAGVIANPTGPGDIWRRVTGTGAVQQIASVADPGPVNVHEVRVEQAQDANKPPGLHSVLVQAVLTQQPGTSGMSPDSIYVTFDAAAEIVGILISVDIAQEMRLVEVAAGINDLRGYGKSRDVDWLIHTSHASSPDGLSGSGGGKIDEALWFGEGQGFDVAAGDHVAIGAWLQNAGRTVSGISPEVIVYYVWR